MNIHTENEDLDLKDLFTVSIMKSDKLMLKLETNESEFIEDLINLVRHYKKRTQVANTGNNSYLTI